MLSTLEHPTRSFLGNTTVQNSLQKKKWEKIELAFNNFGQSNFFQHKKFHYNKIRTIGIVAGFNDFKADISVSEIGFN